MLLVILQVTKLLEKETGRGDEYANEVLPLHRAT